MDQSVDVQKDALRCLEGTSLELAFSAEGSLVLQEAIEAAHRHSLEESLVSELHGHVRALMSSSSGIDVLIKCLETLDATSTIFIAHELVGHAVATALSDTGYELICHVLENQTPEHVHALI